MLQLAATTNDVATSATTGPWLLIGGGLLALAAMYGMYWLWMKKKAKK